MDRTRRRIPATELRVHLGEALKALENEDLVIEKGGFPVAVLIPYNGTVYRIGKEAQVNTNAAYARAVVRPGNPAAIEGALAAMALGWVGIDADAVVASIYAAREAGATTRVVEFEDEEGADEDEVSDRLGLLRPRPQEKIRRVADAPDEGYRV